MRALGPTNNSSWLNSYCNGLWPGVVGGASRYVGDCYGHDEPGLQFYSALNGSGGNISWNVTLPTAASPTANQSDLYVAIWFGLTLTAPLAWMHECFLELQFYPDASWYAHTSVVPNWTQTDNWVGAAVAWQLDLTNGYEDPCYYEPLYAGGVPGPSYLNMSGGDRVGVAMSGYPGDPYGENLSIVDATSGASSSVTLYDSVNRAPLDPAYPTNGFENALQWTPGGEYPAVFAFETGHPGNPSLPDNGSAGGCDPGPPPASPLDWAVPCPSYDPGSWVNDTRLPWHIDAPRFSDGRGGTEYPSQVAFSQDFGGIDLVNASGGAPWRCLDRVGASFCSYPWYSYSCGYRTFEFGATDWPESSADFGAYRQFAESATANAAMLGYYPPTNRSIPTCGARSASVTVGTDPATLGGSVYFLSRDFVSPVNVSSLALGNYSLHAMTLPGSEFAGWETRGGVSVGIGTSPWTCLRVRGAGSVLARFSSTPNPTRVEFDSVGGPGSLGVQSSQILLGNGSSGFTVANHTSFLLRPGVYSIQAYPPVGMEFGSFAVNSSALELAAPGFPFTWLVVTGTLSTARLVARFVPSSATATLTFGAYGPGTLTVQSVVSGTLTGPPGAYTAVARAAPGAEFAGWSYYGSDYMTNFSSATFVTLEQGSSYLYADFSRTVTVTLLDGPAVGGSISFNGALPAANGSEASAFAASYYGLIAVPAAGYHFTGWSVNSSSAGFVLYPASEVGAYLYANSSVAVRASFAVAPVVAVTALVQPAGRGALRIDWGSWITTNTTYAGLTADSYQLESRAASGYRFGGWSVSGGLAVTGTVLTVSSPGRLVATFLPLTVGVTLETVPASASRFALTNASGQTVSADSGSTLWLAPGTFTVNLTVPSGSYLQGWASTPGLGASGSDPASLTVDSAGTLIAQLAPFGEARVSARPALLEVGDPLNLTLSLAGNGSFSYAWSGLPTGCVAADRPTILCQPTGAGVYSVDGTITSAGIELSAPPVTVDVGALLAEVNLTSTPVVVELGFPFSLNAAVTGGVGPFVYSYLNLPPGCVSADTPTLSCRPQALGRFDPSVQVLDARSHGVSNSTALTVVAALSVAALELSRPVVALGGSVELTVNFSGGIGPFGVSFVGLPPGCSGNGSAALLCTPRAPGVYPVVATVRDSGGAGGSASATLTVRPALAVRSFGAFPSEVTVGQQTFFTVNATGGAGALSFSYLRLPPDCQSANLTQLACTPRAAGNYSVGVQVRDTQGSSVFANTSLLVRNSTAAAPPALSWTTLALFAGLGLFALLAVLLFRRGAGRGRPGAAPGAGRPGESVPTDSGTPEDSPPRS